MANVTDDFARGNENCSEDNKHKNLCLDCLRRFFAPMPFGFVPHRKDFLATNVKWHQQRKLFTREFPFNSTPEDYLRHFSFVEA